MLIVYSSPEIEVKAEDQHEIETTLYQLREEMRIELEQIKTVDWRMTVERTPPQNGNG